MALGKNAFADCKSRFRILNMLCLLYRVQNSLMLQVIRESKNVTGYVHIYIQSSEQTVYAIQNWSHVNLFYRQILNNSTLKINMDITMYRKCFPIWISVLIYVSSTLYDIVFPTFSSTSRLRFLMWLIFCFKRQIFCGWRMSSSNSSKSNDYWHVSSPETARIESNFLQTLLHLIVSPPPPATFNAGIFCDSSHVSASVVSCPNRLVYWIGNVHTHLHAYDHLSSLSTIYSC